MTVPSTSHLTTERPSAGPGGNWFTETRKRVLQYSLTLLGKYDSSVYLNGFWFIYVWQDGVYIAGKSPRKWLTYKYFGKTMMRVNRLHSHLILNCDDKCLVVYKVGEMGEKLGKKVMDLGNLFSEQLMDFEWIGESKIAVVMSIRGLLILEYDFEKMGIDNQGFDKQQGNTILAKS